MEGSNRSSTGGRTHTWRLTGVPGVWPLLGLPMTSAMTTYQNTAGRTPQGASGREASQPDAIWSEHPPALMGKEGFR